MSGKLTVTFAGLVLVALMASLCYAAPMFVATAQNFRGAIYQGVGPTPGHACESAMVKCSQDSFIPPSCKVVAVRAECPPPVCYPAPPPMAQRPMAQRPMRKSVTKSASPNYPATYSWGRPMP
jgi:hypothetical protein